MSTKNKSLLYAVDENPPFWMAFLLALQHLVLILSGIIMVPLIVGRGGGLSIGELEYFTFTALLVSGLTTLLQIVRFGKIGSGFVLFMGSSSAFIACGISAVKAGGLSLMATLVLLSSPVELLFSYFLRHLRKIITPAVGGVVIMLITIALVPIAMNLWRGIPGSPNHDSLENFLAGTATLITIILISLLSKPGFKIWGPLIGIGVGYLVAYFLGIADHEHFSNSPFFGLPDSGWPGFNFEFSMTNLSLLIAFIMATISSSIESVGDAMAVQQVSVRDFKKVNYDYIQGCLYADAFGNLFSGLAGTSPNTTFSGNIPVLEITGAASRRIGIIAAILLGMLAFFPKVYGIILDIPGPVFGGAILILAAILFHTGMGLATKSGLSFQSGLLIGISLITGIITHYDLFFKKIIPGSLTPLLSNGIAAGGIVAILLSILFNIIPRKQVSIRIKASMDNLKELINNIIENSEQLKLSKYESHYLHLSIEEVFTYICNDIPDENEIVKFRIHREETGVNVEIEVGTKVSDVDTPAGIQELETAKDDELDKLSLIILDKIAKDISHIHISGYTYISFKITE